MRLLVFFALTTTALAQPVTFLAPKTIEAGPGCCVIATGDFNGDGKPDVMAGFADGHVSLFAGDGKGGFAPPTLFTAIGGPIVFVAAMDMNRDGLVDLVIANYDRTYVFLASGNGKFQPPYGPAALSSPLLIADVNADGLPDLIQFSDTCSSLQIYFGKGDGTFLRPYSCFGNAGLGQNAAAADLHGDGKVSFVLAGARSDGSFSIYSGDGSGKFSENVLSGSPVDGANRSVALGDFNGDGRPDIVTAGNTGLGIALQNANGQFKHYDTVIRLPESGSAGRGLTNGLFVLDLNGDAKLDILWGSYFFLGNGDGTFQPARFLKNASLSPKIQAVTDLNGDGWPDLINVDNPDYFYSSNAISFSVLLNAGSPPAKPTLAYSAASGVSTITPNSIASIFGTRLVKQTAFATGPNLPTHLAGASLQIKDRQNAIHLAPLFLVSPAQINFLVPADIPLGLVSLTVDDGLSPATEFANATSVVLISPGFFTTNGIPAATALRRLSPGVTEPVSLAAPIDLTQGPVVLTLYGTGFRAVGSRQPYTAFCKAGGQDAELLGVAANPDTPGLDQLSLLLPQNLPTGRVTIQCNFPGPSVYFSYPPLPSNPVEVIIR